MEFNKLNITVNAELTAETDFGRYNLRVIKSNGEITDVNASVTILSNPSIKGNLTYRMGTYSVGWFPWDETILSKAMDDFKSVVEKLELNETQTVSL